MSKKTLTNTIDLGNKNILEVSLCFDGLTISGDKFGSRYIQYGRQDKAGAALRIIDRLGYTTTIKLPEWKNVICEDSNVLKVMKGNRNNRYSDDEKELYDRLETCFSRFVDHIALISEQLNTYRLNDDIWYKTSRFRVPRTDHYIYVVSMCSKLLEERVGSFPIIVAKSDVLINLKPVTVDTKLDNETGEYISNNGLYYSFYNNLLIPVDGINGSEEVRFLDLESTFFDQNYNIRG